MPGDREPGVSGAASGDASGGASGNASGDSSGAVSPAVLAVLNAQKDAILTAVNTQIQVLQSNLLKAQSDLASEIASEVQPDSYVFKKKGNEQQFKFNQKVVKRSVSALKAMEGGNVSKTKEELNEGISLINNRQKIIKLADKSEFEWATVQEYFADDLADDDANTSKIKKAEKRAAAKIKVLQEKKRKSISRPAFSMWSSSLDSSKFRSGVGAVTPRVNYFRPQGRFFNNSSRSFDMCFRCGRRGHWANYCPLKGKGVSIVSRS